MQETTLPAIYRFFGLMSLKELELKCKALENLIAIEDGRINEVWSKQEQAMIKPVLCSRFYEEWKRSYEIIQQVIEDKKNGQFDIKIKMDSRKRKSNGL
jgi:hypothetical protein